MSRRLLAVILSVFALGVGAAAQERKPPPAQPPQGTGRISGTVVNTETGRPVRLAEVTLASSAGDRTMISDDAGGFSFEKLPAGMYNLRTSKPGFLDTIYGQARPGTDTPGRRISLKDREEITRLVAPLSQGGSISGVVRDEHGDPVFEATVNVSRWVMRGGKRTLQGIRSTQSDEHGRFRLGLLPSRQYVVTASPADHGGDNDDRNDDERTQGFAPVFYPSSFSAGSAETIALGVGEQRVNTDIIMPRVKLSKITGVVVDASGRPVPEFHVSLVDDSLGEWMEKGTVTEADGRFVFKRVPPGNYVVTAGDHGGGLKSYSVEFDGGTKGNLRVHSFEVKALIKDVVLDLSEKIEDRTERERGSGSVDVTVSSDVTPNVVLRLEPPRNVIGRVVFEGASPQPTTGVEVMLSHDKGFGAAATVAQDGTFAVKDVPPGKYFVEVRLPGGPWTLASAISAGVDALDFQLDVPRDRDVRDFTLTFRDRSTELSGAVIDAASQPVIDRRVIVFPSDERLWVAGTERIQASGLTDAGKFTFGNLRPGSYWLAVVAEVEEDEWLHPEFLRQLIGASVPIRLVDGEKKTQDVRVK